MEYRLAWIHVGGATECQRLQMENIPNIRIRKLTPKECFRLQGWTDDYYEKAEFVNSDSQLYKQAGNSITVDVLCYLFAELFRQYPLEEKNGEI